jgi:diadenosine tetraphosphate (Ap4A) HIT family hydrolase
VSGHEDCVFCAVLAGRVESSMILEDDVIAAFLDIAPMTPGHALVVPRRHAASLAELDPATGGHLFGGAMRVATALRHSGHRVEGVSLFLSDGTAAGQDVFHVHVHVVPRFAGDGIEIRHAGSTADRAALDGSAEAIRAALAARL